MSVKVLWYGYVKKRYINALHYCVYTSKIVTKAAALKVSLETFLKRVGTMEVDIENKIRIAEKYHVQLRKKGSLCDTILTNSDIISTTIQRV